MPGILPWMDDEHPSGGSLLAGRYELGPRLGQGGMATVREALDQRLGRPVAVKILHADLAEQARARSRFETEARAAARLVHPNVVTVFDSGEDNDVPFLVMERLPGQTFADELAAGPVATDRVLGVAREILAAVAAAHAAGIIHRDLKPGNVLLSDDGHVKVSDFGIAKTLDDADQTQTIELLATPAYLAPERLLGEPASERSDLYSIGVLLYEALSGTRPFRGDTPVTLMRAIERGDAEPLTSARPDLPADVVALVERAMAVDPGLRFISAIAMASALDAANATASLADFDETVAIDRRSRDGLTQSLPTPIPLATEALGPRRNGRMRINALAIGIGAALAAVVLAVALGQRDPARPAAPITATTATTHTTPTTASPTTIASTVTTATSVTTPAVEAAPPKKSSEGKHKGKP